MKNRLKKVFTVILCILTVAGLATGCGKSEKSSDTITLVWYPNESADIFKEGRDEVARLVEEATGKKVEHKLTTDYTIAIESIANGTAQIGCMEH